MQFQSSQLLKLPTVSPMMDLKQILGKLNTNSLWFRCPKMILINSLIILAFLKVRVCSLFLIFLY